MSNYRRLISYIYAYEGGVKGKNIGFAKLEARNGQCKISVNVKKVYVGGNDLGVYLLSGKEEILLGKIFIRNGAGEFRATVNVNNVDGRNCTMDQCYGLTVHDLESSWQSYMTIWEDAVAHAAEVELADVTAENRLEKELAQNQAKITESKQPVYIHSVVKEIEAELQAENNQEIAQEIAPFENKESSIAAVSVTEKETLKAEGESGIPAENSSGLDSEASEALELYQPEEETTHMHGGGNGNPSDLEATSMSEAVKGGKSIHFETTSQQGKNGNSFEFEVKYQPDSSIMQPGNGLTQPGAFRQNNRPTQPGADMFRQNNRPMQPGTGAFHPSGDAMQPDIGTFQPDNSPMQPGTGAFHPSSNAMQPDTGTFQQNNRSAQPGAGTFHSDSSPAQPDTGVLQPNNSATQPGAGMCQQPNSLVQPNTGAIHPLNSTMQPGTDAFQQGSGNSYQTGENNGYQHNRDIGYQFGMSQNFQSNDSEPAHPDSEIPTLESIIPGQDDFMPYITAPYHKPQKQLDSWDSVMPTQENTFGNFGYSNCFSPETITESNNTMGNQIPGGTKHFTQPAGSVAAQPWEARTKPDNPTESYSSKTSPFPANRPTSDKSEQSFKSQPEPMKTSKTLSEAVKTVLEPLFSNVSGKTEGATMPSFGFAAKESKTDSQVNDKEPAVKPIIINPESEAQKSFLGSPEELERLQNAEQEENNHLQIWNQFSKTYPKIQAFDYDKGCEILTIKPKDIGLLPRETWVFGNNSFLLHGYYNYRYLILAKLQNPQGQPRYLLGVPGHYYSNEKYMASMFGFPNFVLAKNQPTEDGRFGYWYTDIRLSDQ